MTEEKQETKYPIAEKFVSPQGEGVFTGALMAFIRLAGCTVGKPFPKERYTELPHCKFECEGGDPDMGHGPTCAYVKSANNLLPIYTEKCTLYDGRSFPCDTDYRVKERLTIAELGEWVPSNVRHVCVTGGEPFMHNLAPFWDEFFGVTKLHIETSGTIPLEKAFAGDPPTNKENVWITVSPKYGVLPEMIKRANEIKLLVDIDFDIDKLPNEVKNHPVVYIQPVNYEHAVNKENLKRVMELQKKYPQFRVSLQLHKVLSDYLGERVL